MLNTSELLKKAWGIFDSICGKLVSKQNKIHTKLCNTTIYPGIGMALVARSGWAVWFLLLLLSFALQENICVVTVVSWMSQGSSNAMEVLLPSMNVFTNKTKLSPSNTITTSESTIRQSNSNAVYYYNTQPNNNNLSNNWQLKITTIISYG